MCPLVAAAVVLAGLPATAQADYAAAPPLRPVQDLTRSYHRPSIVRDEYGTDNEALLVYTDKAVEIYVPDVTAESGYMRLRQLKMSGTFTVMFYVYGLKDEQTDSYLVSVDAPNRTISIRTDAFASATVFTFDKAPYAIAHAVLNVVNIMQREIVVQHVVP